MPRPPIHPFWREQIRSVTANNPKFGPGPVLRELEALGKRMGRTDWPSIRTVGRVQSEFRATSENIQSQYREFRWPEAMERGDYPWEAGAILLEFLREASQPRTFAGGRLPRPSMRLAKWFWRVSLSAPTAPASTRLNLAQEMAIHEVLGTPVDESLEVRVAYPFTYPDEVARPEYWFGWQGVYNEAGWSDRNADQWSAFKTLWGLPEDSPPEAVARGWVKLEAYIDKGEAEAASPSEIP